MIEKCMLTIMVLQLAIIGCCAVSGIIWLKQKQEFVQLSSIPQFAALQKENLATPERISDMKNEIIKVVYYEVRGDFKEINNTKNHKFLILYVIIL